MKVVIDTNVLLSGANDRKGSHVSGIIMQLWLSDRFELLTSEWQIDEIKRVSRYPRLKKRFGTARIGHLINALRAFATILEPDEIPTISPDPDDNFILAVAFFGEAQYLVSRNRVDLLQLSTTRVKIVTELEFLQALR